MMKAAFFSTAKTKLAEVYSLPVQSELKQYFSFYDGMYNMDNIGQLKDVECLFSTWGMPELNEEEIKEYFPKLKVLFYGAGSIQKFGRPFLNLGIRIASAWLANSVPVVEYTTAQIILANKGFYQSMRRFNGRENRDDAVKHFASFPGNYDTKVGLIGLGSIGAGVAERLKTYRLTIYAYDPYCSQEKAEKLGVTLVSLEEMFRECQVISNHLPDIPDTVGMLNGSLFSLMKDNGVFLNTGRGAQVVEGDLIAALKEKPERTAVLDVTHPEPPKEDSEFYKLDNVFLTPHIAGSAGKECMRMGEYMLEEAREYINGEKLRYEVTLKMLETMA